MFEKLSQDTYLVDIAAGAASLVLLELVFGCTLGDWHLLGAILECCRMGRGVSAETKDDRVVDAPPNGSDFRVGDF